MGMKLTSHLMKLSHSLCSPREPIAMKLHWDWPKHKFHNITLRENENPMAYQGQICGKDLKQRADGKNYMYEATQMQAGTKYKTLSSLNCYFLKQSFFCRTSRQIPRTQEQARAYKPHFIRPLRATQVFNLHPHVQNHLRDWDRGRELLKHICIYKNCMGELRTLQPYRYAGHAVADFPA
jgi:hypothetical protein